MIQLIPYLNSPETIQELLDTQYKKGRTLSRVILGIFVFKKSSTPKQTNLYISNNEALHYAHMIHQDSSKDPEITISYAQGQKQDLSNLGEDTLAMFYHVHKNLYIKQNNFLFMLPAIFFLLLAYANFNLVGLGWVFLILLFVLLHRYLNYRRFMKKVYKPMLAKTNVIKEKGALKFIIVSDRKLNDNESSQLKELGYFKFSNQKESSYVYILISKTKHITITDSLDSFANINYELFRANS